MNRQKLVLFILLILFAAAVVWAFVKYPRLKTAERLKYPPGSKLTAEHPRNGGQGKGLADERILRIPLLDTARETFKGYRRNVFKPVFVDELKVVKKNAGAVQPVQLTSAQLALQAQKAQQAAAASIPAGPASPRSELARFTYLGFLKKDGRQTVFLAKDKDILLVKKGDVFAGKYEATSLTEQALTIVVTDTGEEIVIPLIENRALSAGK